MYWVVVMIAVVAVVVLSIAGYKNSTKTDIASSTTPVTKNTESQKVSPVQVTPITHATAVLKWAGTVLYTDPTGSTSAFAASPAPDIILITDIHSDHLSTSTLNSMGGTSTIIVPQAVMDLLPQDLMARAKVLKNDETITEQGFQIRGIPMYNLPESADSRHSKGRGNGYVLERDGFRVYVAGDTSGTPEMRALQDIDIAFVPMNLPFTMGVEEAAEAVLAFKPRLVYPYHYRGPDGLSDISKFKQLVDAGNEEIEVILLNWYK